MDSKKIQQGVRLILEGLGEDLTREGLLGTPQRVARAFEEVCAGTSQDASALFEVSFEANHHEIILVNDIEFYSLCEHHLLPFFGRAHVAYIPGESGKVCGLSKLARVVNVFARRLQLQERLSNQIADALNDAVDPAGVFVMIEAEHMCMTMRGVKSPHALTTTIATRGCFTEDETQVQKVLQLIQMEKR